MVIWDKLCREHIWTIGWYQLPKSNLSALANPSVIEAQTQSLPGGKVHVMCLIHTAARVGNAVLVQASCPSSKRCYPWARQAAQVREAESACSFGSDSTPGSLSIWESVP